MIKTEQYILERLDNLERAFLQSQVNNVKVTENADQVPTIKDDVDSAKTSILEVSDTVSGQYVETKTYSKDEYCIYNGTLYRFNMERGKGIVPTNGTYWNACDIATELNNLYSLVKEN